LQSALFPFCRDAWSISPTRWPSLCFRRLVSLEGARISLDGVCFLTRLAFFLSGPRFRYGRFFHARELCSGLMIILPHGCAGSPLDKLSPSSRKVPRSKRRQFPGLVNPPVLGLCFTVPPFIPKSRYNRLWSSRKISPLPRTYPINSVPCRRYPPALPFFVARSWQVKSLAQRGESLDTVSPNAPLKGRLPYDFHIWRRRQNVFPLAQFFFPSRAFLFVSSGPPPFTLSRWAPPARPLPFHRCGFLPAWAF